MTSTRPRALSETFKNAIDIAQRLNEDTAETRNEATRRQLINTMRDNFVTAIGGARNHRMPHIFDAVENNVWLLRDYTPNIVIDFTDFGDNEMGLLTTGRGEILADRRNYIDDNAETPGMAVDMFLDLAMTNTNDSQNVHDVTVVDSCKKIVGRLRRDPEQQSLKTYDTIKNEIMQLTSPDKLSNVIKVLDHMNVPTNIHSLGCSDQECLVRCWTRADNSNNSANKLELQQSIIDSLNDCVENGGVVCPTGRSHKILGSLVLLDYDESNWNINRLEHHKNEILKETKNVIHRLAKVLSTDPDEKLRKVGKSYLANTKEELDAIGEIDDESREKIEELFKTAIDDLISKYIRDNDIKEDRMGNIRIEAKSAIF